ncbi:glycosyl amidation-associated protein WbuZ [bacterium]|nr:glycosyl amidation-associated protein WbuZ [bacterium]
MLKTRIIPCMLFNGFHLVKTIKFGQMRTLGNPIQVARVYNNRNVDELIFMDLLASQEKRQPEYPVIKDMANECFMPLTIGGGIHSLEQVDRLMKIGADKIAINSKAINDPKFITKAANKYGSQCIVVGIDAKYENKDYFVFHDRGTKNTGITVVEWIKKVKKYGAGEIFLNSIDRDGMMEGYDLKLIKKVTDITSVPVIACGGAGKVQDIIDAVLIGNADAASLASLFHYSGHTANSIKKRMAKAEIPVRLMKKL